jgi:Signal transduction histidine kinase regulating C4-dicarboxylate transport system
MLIQENAGWIRDLLDDEDPEKIKNYKEIVESTEKIEQHVKRAKGITQRMLGFGRRMNPGRTEILISSLADQAIEMLKTEANSRNIAIVRQFDAQVPVILSDPAQLEQIFINVIDNAIDAMPWRQRRAVFFILAFSPSSDYLQKHTCCVGKPHQAGMFLFFCLLGELPCFQTCRSVRFPWPR